MSAPLSGELRTKYQASTRWFHLPCMYDATDSMFGPHLHPQPRNPRSASTLPCPLPSCTLMLPCSCSGAVGAGAEGRRDPGGPRHLQGERPSLEQPQPVGRGCGEHLRPWWETSCPCGIAAPLGLTALLFVLVLVAIFRHVVLPLALSAACTGQLERWPAQVLCRHALLCTGARGQGGGRLPTEVGHPRGAHHPGKGACDLRGPFGTSRHGGFCLLQCLEIHSNPFAAVCQTHARTDAQLCTPLTVLARPHRKQMLPTDGRRNSPR